MLASVIIALIIFCIDKIIETIVNLLYFGF